MTSSDRPENGLFVISGWLLELLCDLWDNYAFNHLNEGKEAER